MEVAELRNKYVKEESWTAAHEGWREEATMAQEQVGGGGGGDALIYSPSHHLTISSSYFLTI